jgi:hypothetical protein
MKNHKKSKENGCDHHNNLSHRRLYRRRLNPNRRKTISGRAAYERALANEAIILGENKEEHAF